MSSRPPPGVAATVNVLADLVRSIAGRTVDAPGSEPQEGDYAEQAEDGLVYLKRKDGSPIAVMSRRAWDYFCAPRPEKP